MCAILWVLLVSLLLTKPFCYVYKFVVSNQVATKLKFVIKFVNEVFAWQKCLDWHNISPWRELTTFQRIAFVHVFSKPMLALLFLGEENGFVLLVQGLGFEKLVCVITTILLYCYNMQHVTKHLYTSCKVFIFFRSLKCN